MMARKPRLPVAIAPASKMARAIRARLTTGQDCREPGQVMAACDPRRTT